MVAAMGVVMEGVAWVEATVAGLGQAVVETVGGASVRVGDTVVGAKVVGMKED